jgi:hypothetical protein
MKLIPDVRRVLARAYSPRAMEFAFVADIILNLTPCGFDYLPWWVTLCSAHCCLRGRLIARPEDVNADK